MLLAYGQRRFSMDYFGLFFSFMLPGIVLGVMIAVACHQEMAIQRRRSAKARPQAKIQAVMHTPASSKVNVVPAVSRTQARPAKPVKSERAKLYIYDMNAA